MRPDMTCTLPRPTRFVLRRSQVMLRTGPMDPRARVEGQVACRALRSPAGPVTYRATQTGASIEFEAWGEGAAWAGEHAAMLTGVADDPLAFEPAHDVLARMHRTRPLYLPRTGCLFDELVPAILHQLVTWQDAAEAHAGMVRAFGEPAPGPLGLWLGPSITRLGQIPVENMMQHGVLGKQARAIHRVAEVASRLEPAVTLPVDQALALLEQVPGVGPWTSNVTLMLVRGDPDLVPRGDVHLPRTVAWALTGRSQATDDEMLELLEPFRPHRGRTVALIRASGSKPPRPTMRGRTMHRPGRRGF